MKVCNIIICLLIILAFPLTAFSQKSFTWHAGQRITTDQVRQLGMDRCFCSMPVPDDVFQRMQGKSYKKNKYIGRANLRYLHLLHVDKDGNTLMGEMVCNKTIANDLVEIFRELYKAHYPIERMVLIDNYNADDEKSMRANNTTCFCYRNVGGSKKLSKHSLGMAVDINPLYNPHYRKSKSGKITVSPSTACKYVNSNGKFHYKIVRGDLLYRLFIRHGFRWGGSWKHSKDYQHFEK